MHFPAVSSCLLMSLAVALFPGCPPRGGPGDPQIEITNAPAWGSSGLLQGRVLHVNPCDYAVAVYIYVEEAGGWWTKPTFVDPLTSINNSGEWAADVVTGGTDETAQKIAAFLVPKKTDAYLLGGVPAIPGAVFASAVAHTGVWRTQQTTERLLFFSGLEWRVKRAATPVGPGPNLFADGLDNVWLDRAGRLHLKITNGSTGPRCAEIISLDSFGYGTYTFYLDSAVDAFDPNVVLGLFTWSDDAAYNHREIDVEFARWGDPLNDNAQFVVQPYDREGNMTRFEIGPDAPTAHGFTWRRTYVEFSSVTGADFPPPAQANEIASWHYTGPDVPANGGENARINFWLMNGAAPANGQPAEVVIRRFAFQP